MDEANLCDRIGLIQSGKILEIDTPQNIVNRFDKKLFAVNADDMFSLLKDLRSFDQTESCFAFGSKHHLVLKEDDINVEILKSYLAKHKNLTITQIKPGIEDRFMRLMKTQSYAN